MCGGIGSRFWPFSRTKTPKQFLDFFGTGRSLLQMTYDRVHEIIPPENVILLTNEAYADLVAEQLPEVPRENILCEPARRNTAPCICWASHHILARDPQATMAVLASDHLILQEQAFLQDLTTGMDYAEKSGNLLTFGIKPTSPHTGYGYIQAAGAKEEILKVKSFTEKPDTAMAELFVKSGEFYWNSGMFMWRADAILKAFEKWAPEIASLFESTTYGTPEESDFINRTYPQSPSISIDYAVMEKADNVYVKIANFTWSDLGSWKALHELSPRNAEGNVTQNCKVLATNCTGSVFAVEGDKIVVADGLEGYIVAERDNALLIYPIEKEQSIRNVVNEVGRRFGEQFI